MLKFENFGSKELFRDGGTLVASAPAGSFEAVTIEVVKGHLCAYRYMVDLSAVKSDPSIGLRGVHSAAKLVYNAISLHGARAYAAESYHRLNGIDPLEFETTPRELAKWLYEMDAGEHVPASFYRGA